MSDSDHASAVSSTDLPPHQILAVNAGSSSLKARLYHLEPELELAISAQVDRIGSDRAHMLLRDASGETLVSHTSPVPDHGAAMREIVQGLLQLGQMQGIIGSGHRIVHGGRQHIQPELVDDALLRSLN